MERTIAVLRVLEETAVEFMLICVVCHLVMVLLYFLFSMVERNHRLDLGNSWEIKGNNVEFLFILKILVSSIM